MSVQQYRVVSELEKQYHFVVHIGMTMFLAGHKDDGEYTPIWSNNLQDSAIYCQESAHCLAATYNAQYDPIAVDVDLTA